MSQAEKKEINLSPPTHVATLRGYNIRGWGHSPEEALADFDKKLNSALPISMISPLAGDKIRKDAAKVKPRKAEKSDLEHYVSPYIIPSKPE